MYENKNVGGLKAQIPLNVENFFRTQLYIDLLKRLGAGVYLVTHIHEYISNATKDFIHVAEYNIALDLIDATIIDSTSLELF